MKRPGSLILIQARSKTQRSARVRHCVYFWRHPHSAGVGEDAIGRLAERRQHRPVGSQRGSKERAHAMGEQESALEPQSRIDASVRRLGDPLT